MRCVFSIDIECFNTVSISNLNFQLAKQNKNQISYELLLSKNGDNLD